MGHIALTRLICFDFYDTFKLEICIYPIIVQTLSYELRSTIVSGSFTEEMGFVKRNFIAVFESLSLSL